MSDERPDLTESFLLVRAGAVTCAIPLREVAETMRPLPAEAVAGMPPFVRGLSLIRGRPTPVLDLAALIEEDRPGAVRRYVTLRGGATPVALGVEEVLGVRAIPPERLERLPRLMGDARGGLIERVGSLDERLLMVLRASRAVEEGAL